MDKAMNDTGVTLVTGGTGKVGRRIVERLQALGAETRIGSRSASPAFDWHGSDTWDAALNGVTSVYLAYVPDLVLPGASRVVRQFVDKAAEQGVQRVVLMSGRGEREGYVCERIVRNAGMDWTIVRAAWFMQNFTEGGFLPMILDGALTLPARDIPEPFVDVNDIADVAVAALTEDGHAGETYEVTGPRSLTFAELAEDVSEALGRNVPFVRIPGEAFVEAMEDSGVPDDLVWLMNYLFESVLDGRNSAVGDGVWRALGRQPADFGEFARRSATRGSWNIAMPGAAA